VTAIIVCAAFSTAFMVFWWYEGPREVHEVHEEMRAVVLDGLHESRPNPKFVDEVMAVLQGAGFRVDVFRGRDVTVELLMNLKGYDLLVLRLHSTVDVDGCLYVFSGERYSRGKYMLEEHLGIVRKGFTFNESEGPYFALNIAFLGWYARGGLRGSTIILMGCNGTQSPHSVGRLLEAGVNAFFSWSGYVDLSHSDKAVLTLIRALYLERLSPEEALEEVYREVGPDPTYGSVLRCIMRR